MSSSLLLIYSRCGPALIWCRSVLLILIVQLNSIVVQSLVAEQCLWVNSKLSKSILCGFSALLVVIEVTLVSLEARCCRKEFGSVSAQHHAHLVSWPIRENSWSRFFYGTKPPPSIGLDQCGSFGEEWRAGESPFNLPAGS